MGCVESSYPTVNSPKHGDNVEADQGKTSMRDLEIDTIDRRKNSHFKSNLISEEFNHNVCDFYSTDHTPILGSGISGTVRICVHKVTGIHYALKTLSKKNMTQIKINSLREEIRIMSELDHPNILRLYECFENEDTIFLILELCRGGELLTRLNSMPHHHYTENLARRYVKTMVECIRYCHLHGIVHRDLKLENFILEDESMESDIKLIDFGLSRHFKDKEVLHGAVGTPYYVAPEVLSNNYNNKCDIWSIGVMAFMLVAGFPPFDGKTDRETIELVQFGRICFLDKVFANVSEDAKNFIRFCLNRDVDKRPTACELLQHKWLKGDRVEGNDPVCPEVLQRLQIFEQRQTFVRLCLEVIAHTLTEDQIVKLRKDFLKLDKEHSGEISKEDLQGVMRGSGNFSQEELDRIFAGIDLESGGLIRYHDFLAAALSVQDITEANMKSAFLLISKHSDYIFMNDIKDLLGADATEQEVVSVLREMGLNPSDPISYEQFKQLMRKGMQAGACPFYKRRHLKFFPSPPNSDELLMSSASV